MDKFDRMTLGIWAFYVLTVVIVALTAPHSAAFAVAAGLGLVLLVLIGPPIRFGGKDE